MGKEKNIQKDQLNLLWGPLTLNRSLKDCKYNSDLLVAGDLLSKLVELPNYRRQICNNNSEWGELVATNVVSLSLSLTSNSFIAVCGT